MERAIKIFLVKSYKVDKIRVQCYIKNAFTQKRANKKVAIQCNDEQIVWERAYFCGQPARPQIETTVICKPSFLINDKECSILVISGKPSMIGGLDEGIISAVQDINKGIDDKKLYVMSKKRV